MTITNSVRRAERIASIYNDTASSLYKLISELETISGVAEHTDDFSAEREEVIRVQSLIGMLRIGRREALDRVMTWDQYQSARSM